MQIKFRKDEHLEAQQAVWWQSPALTSASHTKASEDLYSATMQPQYRFK